MFCLESRKPDSSFVQLIRTHTHTLAVNPPGHLLHALDIVKEYRTLKAHSGVKRMGILVMKCLLTTPVFFPQRGLLGLIEEPKVQTVSRLQYIPEPNQSLVLDTEAHMAHKFASNCGNTSGDYVRLWVCLRLLKCHRISLTPNDNNLRNGFTSCAIITLWVAKKTRNGKEKGKEKEENKWEKN